MTTLPADTFWDSSKTEGEASAGWFYKTLDVWKEMPGGAESVDELTISSGSITPTTAAHTVDTEGDAATDDLDTMAVTNHPEARRVIIRAENATRDVVLKHESGGSGQLSLAYNNDVTLDNTKKWVEFILIGTTWYEINRGGFASAGYEAYLKYSDVKATTVGGGSTSAATIQTRTLNTEDSDDSGIGTLSSNQITLPAGNYIIKAQCPAYSVGSHRARLYNVTGSTTLLLGTSSLSANTDQTSNTSHISGKISLSTSSALELRHYTQGAVATTGFGYPSSDGDNEVYSTIEIWKLVD